MRSSTQIKILFLYTELGGYNFACMKHLANSGLQVHVVHFPVNKEAPFSFTDGPGLSLYVNTGFQRQELIELAEKIQPDLLLCSGWVNKDYIAVCRKLKGKTVLVLGLDNQWRGTFKQFVGRIAAPFSFLRMFDKVWVPGRRQVNYARKMGFRSAQIHTGAYCCDVDLYLEIFNSTFPDRKKHFPHRFLYVGRYFDYKGVSDLWSAFVQLQHEHPNDWELWCVGMGDLEPILHPKIKHFGFIQPSQMEEIIKGAGVFIMPSRFDQWGVALQEFAIAGFPLICSNRVGASDTFLKDGVNGYSFEGERISSLFEAMKKITVMKEEALLLMAKASHECGMAITPESWEATLRNLLD